MKKDYKLSTWFYLVLSVCLITPTANDIYLPALPEMAVYFGTDHIQWIMSVFLLGLALPQLVYGPLFDRFGRRPVLMAGLFLFTLASAVCAMADSFSVLMAARFFQAVGACCAVAGSMAIARDVYAKEQLVKVIGFIFLAIGVLPMISPFLGGYLQTWFNWRAGFFLLLIFGALYFLVITFKFKESQDPSHKQVLHIGNIIGNYRFLLQHRVYLAYVITSCFSYATLFGVLSCIPFIFSHNFGLGPKEIGWLCASNGIAVVIMGLISPKVSLKIGLSRWLLIGTVVILIAGLLMLAASEVWPHNFYASYLPILVSAAGIGMIRPTASAGAMHLVEPKIAGSAASLFNFASFVGGGISTAVMAVLPASSFNLAWMIILFGVIAVISAYRAQDKYLPAKAT